MVEQQQQEMTPEDGQQRDIATVGVRTAHEVQRAVDAWIPVVAKAGAIAIGGALVFSLVEAIIMHGTDLLTIGVSIIQPVILFTLLTVFAVVGHDIIKGQGPDWTLRAMLYVRSTSAMMRQKSKAARGGGNEE